MVDISCVHPAGETMWGKMSKTQQQRLHCLMQGQAVRSCKRQTPGYTFVPFSNETYGRLGVETDNLLKDFANEAASTGIWERDMFL
jgi:hypothetical protein